jgi:uncharacterized protein
MLAWLNEPAEWSERRGVLRVVTKPGSDFWRRTHYGFERDNGHLYAHRATGDFVAEVEVAGDYRTLYDQAGIMVRVDEATWMKCGIEFVDGRQFASAVVTREYSDWSVAPLPDLPPAVRFRVARRGDTLEVSWSRPDEDWTMLRLGHLPMGASVLVGPMAASPEAAPFAVRFSGWSLTGTGEG